MRLIVVGLGVQGRKRREFAGDNYVASVDPYNPEADYRSVEDVPLSLYDAALLCIPDEPKVGLIDYLLKNRKHVLVEKPLWAATDEEIFQLQQTAIAHHVVCYTAYNHRFEPHFVQMKALLDSGELGEIYHCRMFYGNGTARLVRESAWRDKGAGVLPDLGSHLLDTVNYWFGISDVNFSIISSQCFENNAPDHVVFGSVGLKPQLEFEMTLLSWRNHFTCDIYAEKGSAHIASLCKWGPTTFTYRERLLPSGRPQEKSETLVKSDPTWKLENDYFLDLCRREVKTDLTRDIWLNRMIRELSQSALREPR